MIAKSVEYNDVILKRMRLIALDYISRNLAEDFANPPEVDISGATRFMCDEICLRVKQEVAGQGPYSYPTARHPRDWKEAVKERFAPAWLLNRWLVKYRKIIFDARIVYPKIALPDTEHHIVVNMTIDETQEEKPIA